MTGKKVSIGAKPTGKIVAETADDWVATREPDPDLGKSNKRLTIDIPESLHRSIKTQCAMRGTKIADELREMLIKKYGNTEIMKSA